MASVAQSQWTAPIALSIVPTAAANLPNGKVLMWSAQNRFSYINQPGSTYTTVFDPVSGTSAERLVTETTHNMFCPGTTNLPDGRLLVNGGSSSGATSLYDPNTNTWTSAQSMNITRGYEANTLLPDGSVLTLGGSYSGGTGGKSGELWTAAGGWRKLSGVPVDPMLGPDPAGVYRGDNHMWLFATANGRVLHAGPAASMNWIDTRSNGSTTPAGPRGDDPYSINGSAVMYDIGKILKTGGAPAYDNGTATNSAHIIDVNSGVASVRRLAPMSYQRAFHNSVVLPNGQVMILGGQTLAVTFSDNRSVLVPELWDPATETFTRLPAMQVPRNYHSSALLLPDARVASMGGGLCGDGCAANHPDVQIYTPNYLLNADGTPATRPLITSAAGVAAYGSTFAVTTDSPVSAFSLVRLSSATHTVNNDQRRIPLQFTSTGTNQYALAIPSNPGIALPGYYMLFALNAAGVPSVASNVRISADTTPQLLVPGDQLSMVGTATAMNLIASGSGTLTYAATGLPPGLTLDPVAGAITGTPTTPGSYQVTVSAANAAGAMSFNLVWTVQPPGVLPARYVKLEALSEVNGNQLTSMAELNLLDTSGNVIPRTRWVTTVDSQETIKGNYTAAKALDGTVTTFWHTQWSAPIAPLPHTYIVDTAGAQNIGGFKYLPRNDGSTNGRIAKWRFHVSVDGINWKMVANGTFANDATEKSVFPIDTNLADRWPVLATPVNPTTYMGDAATVALSATDADGDLLTYAASNLPPGVTVNPSTGVISGRPTTPGIYNATALVSDGRGGTATLPLVWTVLARPVTVQPVTASPVTAGATVAYTAVSDAGSGATVQWDFGDGSAFGTSATVTHLYASAGVYNVALTVTSTWGSSGTLFFTQTVTAAVVTPPTTGTGGPKAAQSSNVVAYTPGGGGSLVWLVNEDGDTVTLFDAVGLSKLGEVAVGSMPRTATLAPNGRLWVANKGSASISVVDPATLSVVQSIALPRASMPYGIAFAPDGSAVYVALEATGQLLKLDPVSGTTLATLSVGPNPRHVAITAGSDRVFVSRFISPPLPGEATAAVQTQSGGVTSGGEMVVVNIASFTVERTVVLQVSDKVDSTVQGRGIPNYLGAAAISPDGASAWIPGKQDNVQRGTLRDGLALDFQSTVRSISSRVDLTSFTEDYASRVDHDNSGYASAAAYHPNGAYVFVALQTSREIAVISTATNTEVLRFAAGRAPDGLAVSADGTRLFVNNLMDRTLQVFDISQLVQNGAYTVPSVAILPSQSTEKLTAQVLQGKQLFYDASDPRLARDSYLSCASCHNDGGHDGRVWDFSSLGEGLRNTIALRGRAGGQGFRHWSGNFDESQDFEGQIRAFAQGTGLMTDALFNTGTRSQPLGLTKAGLSADLDALAAYLASLDTFAPSPLRQADGTLTPTAAAGKTVFAANCLSCHGGAGFTDSAAGNLHDVGTLKPTSGMRLGGPLTGIDTPTLRDVWATAPYLHDGSATSVSDAITAHTAIKLSASDLANVADYVKQIGGSETGTRVARYVRLQALTEANGGPWTSMAEFNVMDASGVLIPHTGWVATADSQETIKGSYVAANAIDGKTGTMWHTQWSTPIAQPPHTFTVDLGAIRTVGGFKYLPRTDGGVNGRIGKWVFLTSTDGVTWTVAGQGAFPNVATEEVVTFGP